MVKFVRWLGAFGQGTSLTDAAEWELSQTARQVAVEPLHRGRSLISYARIGLVVDHEASLFVKGWLTDAFTTLGDDGILRPKYLPRSRQGKAYRDLNRFLAAWSAVKTPEKWAEALFDSPVYSAVVVKASATEHGRNRAKRLAERLGLPLMELAD